MTVSEQIIQVLDALCEKFGVAVDWTSANVIPYIETLCRKLVTYEIAKSIAEILIWLIISIGSIIATKKLYPIFKKGIKNQVCWDVGWDMGSIFAIIGLVVINILSFIIIYTQITDIIKCITFPEMYVFEYISELLSEV